MEEDIRILEEGRKETMFQKMAQEGVSRILFLSKDYLGDEKQKNMKRAGNVLSKRGISLRNKQLGISRR